jgi:hypothetical protein
MRSLSDIPIGHIRRALNHVLNFVPSPALPGGPDVAKPWYQNVCGVDRLSEVGAR